MAERFKSALVAFRFFDINGNGQLSLNEFTLGLDLLGIRITPEEAMLVFETIDSVTL